MTVPGVLVGGGHTGAMSARDVLDPLGGSEQAEHVCPRCGATVVQHFYGPCDACCAELRVKFAATKRDVDVAEYSPKMNVTPNAVALKDD